MNKLLQYYTQRAQQAHATAETAKDPRDKAAWKAAAETWGRLAKPPTEPTYSMAPHQLQLDALKRGVAEAIDSDASALAALEVVESAAHAIAQVKRDAAQAVEPDGAPGCFKHKQTAKRAATSTSTRKDEWASAVNEYMNIEF